MKTLIIDTSTQILYVGFVVDDEVLYEIKQTGANNHSEHLLKAIEAGLNKHQMQIRDFNRIIVGIGPGSYTGLRVGLTVAKMFSWTLGISLFTISSLDLMASGLFDKPGIYSIMLHAKQNFIYGKVIEVTESMMQVLLPETFEKTEEFLIKVKDYSINQMIDNQTIVINPLNIQESHLTKVDEVGIIEPNYLRGAM